MYSTLKNIVHYMPICKAEGVCFRYLRYPDKTGKRRIEGGMRFNHRFKKSEPGKPLVSIVTTVLNRESVLEKAMCSVFAQTYDNIEYIIVDAHSADGTVDKILKYEDAVDYFFSEPDSGMYEGINKGISLATGDLILILNSDDWYFKHAVSDLVEVLQNSKADYVSALAVEVDSQGQFLRKIPLMPLGENVRLRMPLRHELMLVPASIYDAVGGYDPTYRIIGDLKFAQKIYDYTRNFMQINDYMMCFRRDGMASDLGAELVSERQRLLKENFPFLLEKEVQVLANEYQANEHSYKSIYLKYQDRKKLISGICAFLRMQNVAIETWNLDSSVS